MTISQEIESLLAGSEPFLSNEDARWVNEFIEHKEFALSLEFMCDKFYGYNKAIPDALGCKIQDICEDLGLSRDRTWEGVLVENDNCEQKLFRLFCLHSDREEVKARITKLVANITYILNEVKKMFEKGKFRWEEDFLDHDEWTLVMEGICSVLAQSKTPITKELYDLIASVIETICMDPSFLDELVVLPHKP